jgi:hypothetical protein
MSRIACIIINFDGKNDTLECLRSIIKQIKNSANQYSIFLIDNGSEQQIVDSDLLSFRQQLSIKLLNLNQNYGFAEGNNIGIREAQKFGYDYYVLLNNDTELVDDSIKRMVLYMDTHPDVGIGGLVNYYYSDPKIVWQAGAKFLKRRFDYRQVPVTDKYSNDFAEVDYVPGSSFFIRKEVIETIGLLDPFYFAYREEADYCWRAKQAGFKVGFLPNTIILHKVGKSSTSVIKQNLRFRNELYFCSKFGDKMDFLIVYIRIFKRTIKLWAKAQFNSNVFKATIIAIKDYNKGVMGKGSIDKLKYEQR